MSREPAPPRRRAAGDRPDVLIVGAGPAGSVAATILARAGVRVRIVDRAAFPRFKLCGDTVNPGALGRLQSLGLTVPVDGALPIHGMVVTGIDARLGTGGAPRAARAVVTGSYPVAVHGLAIGRRELDDALLSQALAAGAEFDAGVDVLGAVVRATGRGAAVAGVRVKGSGARRQTIDARVVLAADGRRSRLAFELGLLRHPVQPRRWAIGGYLHGPTMPAMGEMHIRSDGYIGLSPLPGGGLNACVVSANVQRSLGNPEAFLMTALQTDALLRDRLHGARLTGRVTVLGPLAVEPTGVEVDGLIAAGDAAGFIDPMTGDGLRFAIEGAELAAAAVLRALAAGWPGVHARLRTERERAFAGKWRFNRLLRTVVSSPRAIRAAAFGSRLAPAIVRGLIAHAGDVGLVRHHPAGAAAPDRSPRRPAARASSAL